MMLRKVLSLTGLFLIVGLMLPAIGYAEEEKGAKLTHVLIGSYVAASASDLSTTQRCLGAGTCREANPLLRPLEGKPILFGAVKGAFAAGIATILIKQHKHHPKAVRWVAAGLAVGSIYIAVRNTRIAPLSR